MPSAVSSQPRPSAAKHLLEVPRSAALGRFGYSKPMASAVENWPADHVERWPLARLTPFAANARTHSARQLEQIVASMREWGWTNPVLADEQGTVIAGHGRLAAAKLLGLTEVPVMVAAGWSDAQKRAYVIADNQLALGAGWNEDLLAAELSDLQQEGVDLDLIGFDAKELTRLLGSGESVEGEDQVPAVPDSPVTRPGDVWLLGPHRLLCGDATAAADVARLLAGLRPHLMVTDPPYGVDYDPAWRNDAGTSQTRRTGKVMNDDRADWREAWELFPGEVAYVWHGALHAATVAESLGSVGFEIRSQIIWTKERLVLSRGHYHWQHEPCWYAVKSKGKGSWSGDRKQTTVWPISSREQDAETVHGTQKPVECMRRPMLNNSSIGQAIYEPFMGSGTTLIAAETCQRVCVGIELNPAYIDVAVQRWQQFTGEKALLEGEGADFASVAAARCPADGPLS